MNKNSNSVTRKLNCQQKIQFTRLVLKVKGQDSPIPVTENVTVILSFTAPRVLNQSTILHQNNETTKSPFLDICKE